MKVAHLAKTLDGFLARINPLLKAVNPEDLPTHDAADNAAPQWIQDFLDVVAETQGKLILSRIEAAIAGGDMETVLKTIPWETMEAGLSAKWMPAIEKLVHQGAIASAGSLPPPPSGGSARFDITNPRAQDWVKGRAADLVTQVTDESRKAIKGVIQRAFDEGTPPYKVSRAIRQEVGLLDRHAAAVEKYQARLLDQGFKPAKAEAAADRYAAKLLKYRAENIARTETLTASNRGQLELWRQAAEQGFLPKHVRREWLLTDDDRLCPTCAEMAGATAGLDEVFTGPVDEAGKVLADNCETPPLHPACRCSQRILFE